MPATVFVIGSMWANFCIMPGPRIPRGMSPAAGAGPLGLALAGGGDFFGCADADPAEPDSPNLFSLFSLMRRKPIQRFRQLILHPLAEVK